MIDLMINGDRLEVLSEAECLSLLASAPVGRVVFTDKALPAIAVVNHLVHHGEVIFRSVPGGRLDAVSRLSVVAYQADSLDPENGTGWSVVVLGVASRVTNPTEVERLSTLPLRSWIAAPGTFVRIRIELISGRRVVRELKTGPEVAYAVPADPS